MTARVAKFVKMETTLTFLHVFFKDVIYLSPVLLSLLALICGIGVTIGKIEGWSIGTAIYHAFINATTVGYGDFHPTRPASRVLSVINALIGLLLTGVFVGVAVHSIELAVLTNPKP